MAGSFYEAVSGELCNQSYDAKDAGFSRYSFLLSLSRALAREESFHVRLLELEGGQAERANLPTTLQ